MQAFDWVILALGLIALTAGLVLFVRAQQEMTAAKAERLAARVRPAYVHVDVSAPGVPTDPATARLLETTRDVGAVVLAVGVDSAADRDTALALGATYGRGSLLGAPAPAPR